MFGNTKDKDQEIRIKGLETEIDGLKKEKMKLHEEVEKAKLKKKIEEEDIKHMIKIREEKLDLQFQKKTHEMEAKKTEEIAKVKDQYRDKMETRLEKEASNIKEMYGQILQRLPDVNVRLKGDV